MHQLDGSQKEGGSFLNLHQKEGVPRKDGGGGPQKRGSSNPGGNYSRLFAKIDNSFQQLKILIKGPP